jgi:regulator of protease activity HflC (stomatin/prohibitin superfamily)
VNSARGQAEAQVLEAEARQKAAILAAEGERQAIVLKARADQERQVLQAQATAQALKIVAQSLQQDPKAAEALQFLIAQSYLATGQAIGSSNSSKVMFMDPRNILSTLESLKTLTGD